jgi:hypothetical protein
MNNGEFAVAIWTQEELRKIAEGDDLHIAPLREDGVTFGTATWVWSVCVDDDLFVCAYNGTNSFWYQAALRQKAGRIIAAGITKEMLFEPVSDTLDVGIDEAYRTKYRVSPYLNLTVNVRARAATVKVISRPDGQ